MDLIEQVRKCANGFPLFKTRQGDFGICDDAADEIERLRVKFWEIIKLNPFHNATPPIDKQYYAQIIIEMINVANAALKDGE